MIPHGPVDVLVMAAGEPRFDPAILAELERQASSGTIRVLDAMILLNDEHGNHSVVDIAELPEEQRVAVGFIDLATHGLFDSDDARTLFEGMVPGSAVIALAIEHTWAIALVNALHQSGMDLALNFRVPESVVDDAFGSLGVKK